MSFAPHRRRILVALALVLATLAVAFAQEADRPLPGAVLVDEAGATLLRFEGRELVYVRGLGWLAGIDAPPPRVVDGVVIVAAAVADALGGATAAPDRSEPAPGAPGAARLTAVRTSGDVDVRVVLDLDGVAVEALRRLGTIGRSEADAALHLDLPPLALPADLPTAVGAFDLRWRASGAGVRLEVDGVAFTYDVFALAAPTRLVLDLRPDRGAIPAATEVVEELAPGVVYRSFRAVGSEGPSRVHVLEIAPNGGEWRVVGASGDPRSTRSWATGAFAAINAGYFEPTSRAVIGFLVVDGAWLSPPSRGRAAVGFGPDGVLIDRVRTRVGVAVDGRLVLDADHEAAERVALQPGGGWAGSGSVGVLVLDADDRVTANRVGPVLVPPDGRAVVYPPELRALALVDPGARVAVDLRVDPPGFATVRYAVEAGPLLLRDGQPAFAPEREAFVRGVRILDEVTQQAAIGVRADGTVLLVAAEAMVAADLIAVFERLGAWDAMRLDSGGSTTLVAGDEVLNRQVERLVATAIVWHPAGSP